MHWNVSSGVSPGHPRSPAPVFRAGEVCLRMTRHGAWASATPRFCASCVDGSNARLTELNDLQLPKNRSVFTTGERRNSATPCASLTRGPAFHRHCSGRVCLEVPQAGGSGVRSRFVRDVLSNTTCVLHVFHSTTRALFDAVKRVVRTAVVAHHSSIARSNCARMIRSRFPVMRCRLPETIAPS